MDNHLALKVMIADVVCTINYTRFLQYFPFTHFTASVKTD